MARATHRWAAVMLVCALMATACGTRLSEEDRQAYAAAQFGGGDGQAVPDGAAGPEDPGGGEPDTDGGATAAPAAGDDGDAGTDTTSSGGQTGGGGTTGDTGGDAQDPGGGETAPPADDGQAGEDGGEQPDPGTTDTRAAPAGGNGGATDVGVTETEIVIYNVSDLTGAVQGLFRDAYEATLAYIQYFTATEGTVYGRQIRLESRDSQLSTQGNRSAYLDACDRAFAAVGSMSAFEEGAADPIQSCSFPDLRNIRTSQVMQGVPTSYGTAGQQVGQISLSEWTYYKEQFPDAVQNSGFVWLENQTTNYQVGQYISGTERIGYQWNAQIRLALSQTNYASVVTELKNKNIQFVAFQGAYQQAARLVGAMEQQGYEPQVFALQANNYTPDLIETCGAPCEKYTLVAQTGSLLEEADANPELQLYADWLARVNPRARPTGLGMYSWSAAKLFVETIKKVGPELTREGFLEELRNVTSYDANGLIPEQNIAEQTVVGCTIMLDIQGGQFVRIAPSSGYRCEAGPA